MDNDSGHSHSHSSRLRDGRRFAVSSYAASALTSFLTRGHDIHPLTVITIR